MDIVTQITQSKARIQSLQDLSWDRGYSDKLVGLITAEKARLARLIDAHNTATLQAHGVARSHWVDEVVKK